MLHSHPWLCPARHGQKCRCHLGRAPGSTGPLAIGCCETACRGKVDRPFGSTLRWGLKMTIMTIMLSGRQPTGVNTWSVARAKARLSEVIEKARAMGPQTITRHGRTAVVVVAAEEWKRRTERKGNLAEFFASSPLRRSGLRIGRLRGPVRKTGL